MDNDTSKKSGSRTARRALAGMLLAALVSALGCGAEPTPVLPPEAFVQRRPGIGPGSNEAVDRAGPLTFDAQHAPTHQAGSGAQLSPRVEEAVQPLDVASATQPSPASAPAEQTATTPPSTEPSTVSAGKTTGQYQIVGSVLADVNGRAIFAEKALSFLDRALAAEARRLPEDEFRMQASVMVRQTVDYLVDNEVEFAAAEKALDKKDEELAKLLTGEWRKTQIRMAGGSDAIARQRAAQDGQDFEEQAREQFRLNMIRIYLEKKIKPLIQISAQDLRHYYQENIRKFTVPSAAQFRVIKIDVSRTGGRAAAVDKAKTVYDSAREGEDFAALASRINDDPYLMRRHGAVGDEKGWIERGAYALDKVEEAAWKLQPGQVTTPVDTGDALYVAKLEAIQPGRTRSFENLDVQDRIYDTLWRQQFTKLRDAHLNELKAQAITRKNENRYDTVLDMVMQRYPQWAKK